MSDYENDSVEFVEHVKEDFDGMLVPATEDDYKTCPDCNGSGETDCDEHCDRCDGFGEISEEKS